MQLVVDLVDRLNNKKLHSLVYETETQRIEALDVIFSCVYSEFIYIVLAQMREIKYTF